MNPLLPIDYMERYLGGEENLTVSNILLILSLQGWDDYFDVGSLLSL